MRRVAAAVAAALLGLVVGVGLVAVHPRTPGLVLGAAAAVSVLAALPRGWWARPPYVVGLAVVVVLTTTPRPEGDYLVAADTQGYVLLGLTLVLVVAGLVGSARPRRAARDREEREPPLG